MTLAIDSTTLLQQMDGFGAAGVDATTYSTSVADFLWSTGLGLTIFRSELWINTSSGIQSYSQYFQPMYSGGNTVQGDWSLEKQAYDRGVRTFILTCWAPPSILGPWPWLVSGSQNGALLASHYADLATAFTSALSNAMAAGVYITHVSPANEPDITPGYAQTSWSTAQLVSFVKNNLGPALATWAAANPAWQAATGLSTPQILISETAAWSALATWIAAFEADATALSYVSRYASHQYFGGGASAPPSPCSRAIWMTETTDPNATYDTTMTSGLVIAAQIYAAINTGTASAWVHWFANDVSDNNNSGLIGTNAANWSNQAASLADWNAPTLPKRAYVLGNFSKIVTPKSNRCSLSGSPAGVNSLAFKRPDGRLVLVCINTNSSPTALSVSGLLTTPSVTPWLTDSSHNLSTQPPISVSGGAFSTTLPASSVTTFLGDAPVQLAVYGFSVSTL
jgi:O-glycosyl hydrolase